jgi:hypothetical protein
MDLGSSTSDSRPLNGLSLDVSSGREAMFHRNNGNLNGEK